MRLQNREANAILISIFIMSLLLGVSLTVNEVIISDISVTRQVVQGAQSLNAAEGMVEWGLWMRHQHLPGYETVLSDQLVGEIPASLTLKARGDLQDEAGHYLWPCEGGFRALAYEESVHIPLFAETDAGLDPIHQFGVEFYIGDADGNPRHELSTSLREILRWTVTGLLEGQTEAISEFIALEPGKVEASFFGPSAAASAPEGYSSGQYRSSVAFVTHNQFPISEFLAGHDHNYLKLQNFYNDPSSFLYVRLLSTAARPVCEVTDVIGSGSNADSSIEKTVKSRIRLNENLPVFDFSLYHTGEDE